LYRFVCTAVFSCAFVVFGVPEGTNLGAAGGYRSVEPTGDLRIEEKNRREKNTGPTRIPLIKIDLAAILVSDSA
jgi:hypothetical protein